jgi:hypothetical protein
VFLLKGKGTDQGARASAPPVPVEA